MSIPDDASAPGAGGSGGHVGQARRRGDGRDHAILLADVARSFFVDGLTKVQIASDLGMSRFQVAKLLDEAQSSGVVTIEIRDPRRRPGPRADDLARALGVTEVRVIGSGSVDLMRIGAAAMDELRTLARAGNTIGISWSRTLDSAAAFLPDLPVCDVVQLAGALTVRGGGFLARVMAQLFAHRGVHTFPIPAPLVVGEQATAADLLCEPAIADAVARFDRLDLALISIGAWRSDESTVWERVSPADRKAARDAGAVAEISGRLVDREGQPVHTALDGRTIGIRIEQLVRVPRVIAVAHGAARRDAVLAAVRAGVVSHLVVDGELAAALLDELGETDVDAGAETEPVQDEVGG